MSTRRIRVVTVGAAGLFLAVALGIRFGSGDGLDSNGRLQQYSGTAFYASMVYAGVVFIRPRINPFLAGAIALGFCWAVEFAQLTAVPAALSAHSVIARLVVGVSFDWTDVAWYPVGIAPLVAIDAVIRRRRPATAIT